MHQTDFKKRFVTILSWNMYSNIGSTKINWGGCRVKYKSSDSADLDGDAIQ